MKKNKWNVLVFPGGTEIGLEIYKSLAYCKEITLFSVSSAQENHAEFVFLNHHIIPNVFESSCITELLRILREWKIDVIYPANAYIIDFLVKHREIIPVKIILPSNEVVQLTRSKRACYDYLRGDILVPTIYVSTVEIISYPVFVKPNSGYGAQGAKKINSEAGLQDYLGEHSEDETLICEYLAGEEYTVDCFSSKKGLLFSRARKRERIRMGTSMRATPASTEIQKDVKEIAEKIVKKLSIEGAWFFQVKRDKPGGQLKLLEIEVRIAGTMAMNRARGVNFPLLSIYNAFGFSVEIMTNDFDVILDRSLANRYKIDLSYENVYVDLDDTLLIKGKVNQDLMKFLYQCFNKKIKLILITKSLSNNLFETLRQYRISELFDEVIHLKEEDKKENYINKKQAIFIDDSYSQRAQVHAALAIPTFDMSMLEVLIDDRT
ncbi:MAG: ATP-grasp domain-containing protein [Pseudomonadota bacterium]